MNDFLKKCFIFPRQDNGNEGRRLDTSWGMRKSTQCVESESWKLSYLVLSSATRSSTNAAERQTVPEIQTGRKKENDISCHSPMKFRYDKLLMR